MNLFGGMNVVIVAYKKKNVYCNLELLNLLWSETMPFADALLTQVCSLHERVLRSQRHLTEMQAIMAAWTDAPVFTRVGGGKDGLLTLQSKDEQLNVVWVQNYHMHVLTLSVNTDLWSYLNENE